MEGIVSASLTPVSQLHSTPLRRPISIAERSILEEAAFRRMLMLETKRSQRSGKPFFLALFESESLLVFENGRNSLGNVLSVLDSNTRDTDVTGWYTDELVVGVMFTEIAVEAPSSILATIMSRVNRTLRNHMNPREFTQLGISFHAFPEKQEADILSEAITPPVYTESLVGNEAMRVG
jgi:hypothetical protein